MPEPNLPPLILSRTTHPVTKEPFDVAQMQSTLPEMPYQARSRIIRDHGLSPEMAGNLIIEPEYLKFFEDCVRLEVSNKTVLANLLLYEVNID